MNEEVISANESEEIFVEENADATNTASAENENIPSEAEVAEVSEDQNTILQMQNTILALKEQISELKRTRDAQEKMLGELSDFTSLFPAVDIDSIPESVWESVKKGTSLAAAYALYEKRAEAERLKIEKINSINSARSAGVAGKNTANEFFTPDDVRKMSRAEVHANFSKIKNSMKKWN